MFKESSIFNREHRIAQNLGDVLILNEPALLPVFVKQIGNQQRLDFVGIEWIV